MNIETVLYAWERWNDKPGDHTRAGRLIDVLKVAAANVGMTEVDVRLMVVRLWRSGMTLEEAIREVLE